MSRVAEKVLAGLALLMAAVVLTLGLLATTAWVSADGPAEQDEWPPRSGWMGEWFYSVDPGDVEELRRRYEAEGRGYVEYLGDNRDSRGEKIGWVYWIKPEGDVRPADPVLELLERVEILEERLAELEDLLLDYEEYLWHWHNWLDQHEGRLGVLESEVRALQGVLGMPW